MHSARVVVICIVVSVVVPAVAATHVTLIGEPAGAELCRFPAGDAANPFGRWFRSQDVTCTAATDVTFPPGLWNVFARSGTGISIQPMLIDAATKPESIALSLTPAAALRAQLPSGTSAVVYAPHRAIAYPLADRTAVPSGEELWLFIVSKSSLAAVLQIPAIPAGAERTVDARDARAEGIIAGWLHVSEEDRTALKSAHGVRPPQIVVASGSKKTEALPLPDVDLLDGAIVLLREVAPGAAELQLSGRGWLTRRQQIRVEPHRITTLTEPIVAAASATLTVNWSVPNNLAALDRSLGSCEPGKETPRFELTMSLCAPAKQGESAPPCQPVKTEALRLDQTFGTAGIEETPPGVYRAEIRYGKLPPVGVTTTIAPLTQRPVYLTAQYFEGYGNFTRGDAPVADDATLAFPGGGVGFSARGSGEYRSVLTQPFDTDARIDISTCSGDKAFVLADRPLRRNARFDIDIPDNSLTITIIDTFTRMSVTKANVRLQIMNKTARLPVVTTNFSDAKFQMREIPERELRIEVTASGYKKKNVDSFSIGRTENKELEIQLEPVSGRQGLLISSHPFQNATIFWFSASGSEIERADVAPDGTFAFDADHYRDETMTVVSASHPLWITRPPQAERSRTLEVHFPDGVPARKVDILFPQTPPRFTTVVGVAIGGLRVPQQALARHQALRNLTTVTTGEGLISILALAETGPIDILRGPSTFVPQSTIEFFAVRDFPPVELKRLQPGVTSVVFGPR